MTLQRSSPISSSRLFFLGGGLSPTTECLSAESCGKEQFRIHMLQGIDRSSIEEIRYEIEDMFDAQAEMSITLVLSRVQTRPERTDLHHSMF